MNRMPKKPKSCCPLTSDKTLRNAADALAASVRDGLPSGLASPALRALAATNIRTLEDFTRMTESELLQLHGMGPKAIATIREAMRATGLRFKC